MWLQFSKKVADGSERKFAVTESKFLPRCQNPQFCSFAPRGKLVGECLPQTLLMRPYGRERRSHHAKEIQHAPPQPRSNALDFLPLDRSGNRRFIPVMVYPEQAEVHILEDEAASRAYIGQMWAEAMEIYRSGRFKLAFSPTMQRYLKEHQRDFMPEDTKAGMIQAYLDRYTGSMVCSKQLYKEALNHAFDEPKQWEIREINEIMNQCIDRWRYFPNPRMFSEYGRQKGWERENPLFPGFSPL